MFLELIAVIFAGLAVAGLVMGINRILSGLLPKWLAPVAAGLAMIGVTIASEYGWYARTVDGMPEGLVVAERVENQSLYRPWTYLAPYTDRYMAVDMATLRSHPDQPMQHLADIYFFGRWAPLKQLSTLVDCGQGRRALINGDNAFSQGGEISDLDWITPPENDAILTTVCTG